MPGNRGHFVADAELPGLQMRPQKRLRLVEPKQTVYNKYACFSGKSWLGEEHGRPALTRVCRSCRTTPGPVSEHSC